MLAVFLERSIYSIELKVNFMKYVVIPVTPFEQNCSLVWCEESKEGALIDPGGDIDKLLAAVARHGVTLTKLLLTHGHLDHAGAAGALAERLSIPIIGPHRADQYWLDGLPQQSQMFGFPPVSPFLPTQWLEDGDRVAIGRQVLAVLHTPGHTPGHVVFYSESDRLLWVGDVLFAGSVGRTDFPGGSQDQLFLSIRQKLWPLGDEVEFVPGHGPNSTLGEERRYNPFVADPRFR